MRLIAHRGLWQQRAEANTLGSLQAALAAELGVETDLRAFQSRIYLSHDPIQNAEGLTRFEDFLCRARNYPSQPLFLNVKEDGLLPLLLEYRETLQSLNAVFFDMSVPELYRYSKTFHPRHLSTRVSDIEPYPSGHEYCDWIWVDCFSKELPAQEVKALMARFPKKFAFVSPELHGRDPGRYWQSLGSLEQGYLCTDLVTRYRQEDLS